MTSTTRSGEDTPKRRWGWLASCAAGMTETDRRNSNRFVLWIFAWAVAFVAATLALKHVPSLQGPAGWAVAGAPDLLGLGAFLAYVRFLRQADELQRRIQLEGLAFGFGVGAFFTMGYRLFERVGAPALDVNDPVLVMFVAWTLGQWLAMRRYR